MDCRLPGSSVHGILQAMILEWVSMPSPRRSSWPKDGTRVSCISCILHWKVDFYLHLCVCVSVYVYIHMFYFVFKSFRILEQLSNMNVAFSPLMMWCGDPSFCQQLFPWVKRWSVAYQRPRRAFEAVRYHYQSWSQDCVFEGIKHAGDGQMQVTGTVALP